MEIIFEPTETKIDEMDIEASFHFMTEGFLDRNDVLTVSIGSEKVTTISVDDIVITTLNLQTENEILAFLGHIRFIERKIEIPSWIKDIKMFNDIDQEDTIKQNKEIIDKAKGKICASREVLDKNNEYKSILYTNGDDLVDVVKEILEQMLDYDLSNFVDEGNEDFRIEFNDIIIIGEIKGVTSNVKSEHVSQLDVHKQKYLDKLQEEGTEKSVKSVLIINHQRKNKPDKRQPINEEQIKLAERNESLIIETCTLLKLFQNFRNNKFLPVQFKEILKENTGVLEILKGVSILY